jgi:ubiquinone/menaquinone biosynthesis C-methylase UbiE
MGEPDKREVAVKYDALGGRTYDLRYSEEQGTKYDALLNTMTPGPYETALDIGCGTGLLAERLESRNIGLDISAALLSTALSRLRRKGSSHLIMGDAEALPFRDCSFDQVYSVTLLQNVPDPPSAILEMKRVGRAMAGVTGLKKAFTVESFRLLLEGGGFSSFVILDSSGMNDWVAVIDL